MDDNRQIYLTRQLQLSTQQLLLLLARRSRLRRTLFPIIVQTDLADGAYLQMRGQLPDAVDVRRGHAHAVLRMNTDCGIHKVIGLRKSNGNL